MRLQLAEGSACAGVGRHPGCASPPAWYYRRGSNAAPRRRTRSRRCDGRRDGEMPQAETAIGCTKIPPVALFSVLHRREGGSISGRMVPIFPVTIGTSCRVDGCVRQCRLIRTEIAQYLLGFLRLVTWPDTPNLTSRVSLGVRRPRISRSSVEELCSLVLRHDYRKYLEKVKYYHRYHLYF